MDQRDQEEKLLEERWARIAPLPTKDRRICNHMNFAAIVATHRIVEDGCPDDSKPKAYMCEVMVRCAECAMPFEFMGVDAGLSWVKPMASVDAQKLRAPIQPKGLKLLPAIPGFNVRAN